VQGLNKPLEERHEPILGPAPTLVVEPLPEKNLGVLKGGRWPFTYDPVYGLPVVGEVRTYGAVLRGVREGRVAELLWFPADKNPSQAPVSGRCLVRYVDGGVAQSVIPPSDLRMREAMRAHAVKATVLPPEPREWVNDGPWGNSLGRWYKANVEYFESQDELARRGPRVGPTDVETVNALPEWSDARQQLIDRDVAEYEAIVASALRLDTEDWDAYVKAGPGGGFSRDEAAKYDAMQAPPEKQLGWADKIMVNQEMQAMIMRYVPIVGPIFGSAFIIGLYMLSRLVKGDLTDRMKMMSQEEDKRKRTQLKEARLAFLEEELPALVAKGATLAQAQAKAKEINAKLGSKLEISDTEVAQTYEACVGLLKEGLDIAGASTSSSAADRILAEEEAREKATAQKAAQEGADGGGGEQSDMDALMEMGKLNTARIRKATDPKIMDVKRRVRQARRALKRESKVQLNDEIIFFDDVAGNAEAKVELLEIVDFFRKPEKFKSSGAKAPKGVLLVGPPGNGKTLMARAVAGESGVAFISCSASEFIEMYMGLGAARVRDVFQTARKLAPCIIFIDELDAVGRARRGGGAGNDERDNTVNQLLTEMDGFEAEQQGIVVMGATNRMDVLDAALTRPGRFDRAIEVRRPNFQGRLEAVKVHLRDKPIAHDIDYAALAALTGGMSGAQIAGVCNTSSFIASREGRTEITQADMRAAVEQSKYGRASDVHKFVSPLRKKRMAVMEGSISLVATLLPAIEPVDYVTIMPSAKSPIGRTVLKPNIGRYTTGMWTKRYLREQLLVALAGRAGEELVYGVDELSSLNQHRLMLARQIATKMLNAGMSDHPDFSNLRTLGDQWLDGSSEVGRFTTYTITHDNNQTRSEWVDTDLEMEALLNDSYARVKEMLARNRAALDVLVDSLVAQERMEGSQVAEIVEKHCVAQDIEARKEAQQVALL